MEKYAVVYLIVALLLQPLLLLALGRVVASGLFWLEERLFAGAPAIERWNGVHCLLLGLLSYLLLAFLLRLCTVPWAGAALLPYLLALAQVPAAYREVLTLRPKADLNAVIWFLVVLLFGANLFQATDNISTRWVNNYGDLTFHLGMITSFVLGDNTAPEYHLYPGLRLSYPFLVNLWSASLWWIAPRFDLLSLIFAYQWVFLWAVLYHFLRGCRFCVLPWAVLFGGGSYFALGQNSGPLIEKGVPWTSFLTTIWVTQRSALFGIAILVAVLWFLLGQEHQRRAVFRAGILFALAPLVHVHALLTGILFCGVLLLFRAIDQFCKNASWKPAAINVAVFTLALTPSLLFLPWITGKSGMAGFVLGWLPGPGTSSGFARLFESIKIWGSGAWPMFVVVSFLWFSTKAHRQFFTWLVLFFFFNFVKLAAWEWDQIKIFISLYVILLAIWAQQTRRIFIYLQIPALVLLVPSIFEVWKALSTTKAYEVYSAEAVKQASAIVKNTPPHAIIAAKPDHNTLLTLTGRRIYLGYIGTLASHSIAYQQREAILNDFYSLVNCRKEEREQVCPQYLLWSHAEEQFWKNARPGMLLKGTKLPYLFEFKTQ